MSNLVKFTESDLHIPYFLDYVPGRFWPQESGGRGGALFNIHSHFKTKINLEDILN